MGVSHAPGEATENGLTQQTDKRIAAVLTGARIGERIANHDHKSDYYLESRVIFNFSKT
jgi:hypothetical protein